MATELLPIAATAESSADFAVTEPVTVFIKGGRVDGRSMSAFIEIKASTGQYTGVGVLGDNEGALVIAAPGTYRVRREAGDVAFGVERS